MAQSKVVRLSSQIIEDLEKMRENLILDIMERKSFVIKEFSKNNRAGASVAIRHLDLELDHVKKQSYSDLIQLSVYSYLNDNKEVIKDAD